MNLLALFIYSPTTIQSSQALETETGTQIPPGAINLQPGIYRALAEVSVASSEPWATAVQSSYEVAVFTKTNWPDPPAQAVQQFGLSRIEGFLRGLGDEQSV